MPSPITESALRGARWFAGKHRRIAGVRALAVFGAPPADLTVAEVAYADGPPERYLLPGGGLRWGPLLAALRAAPLAGTAGRVELRPGPALDALLGDGRGAEAIPSTDQTNTLVSVGGRLLVKAYRKLEPGVHPEVELCAALAGTAAPLPAHAGSLHWVAPDGAETAVALLQELVPGAVSGWEAPITAAAAHLAAGSGAGAGADATAPYAAAGAAAGTLHAALAERLGTTTDPDAPARWRAEAEAALAQAAALDAGAAAAADAIRARLAALDAGGPAPVLTRIHGDLHFAQFLRTPTRTLIIDLEGDPTAPLARRRRPDTPLRDLAALLRSIDHIGTAAARRRTPAPDPSAFVDAACAAARGAYEAATGGPADPCLLAALELASECRELVYAHRVLPEWAYAPRAGLARLLARPQPRPEDRPT